MENSNAEEKLISSVSLAVHYLMNALNDAAFLCDYKGNVLLCSDAAVGFFSFKDKSKIIGSDLQSFFGYESTDSAFSVFKKISAKSENRETGIFQIRLSAKEIKPVEVTFAALSPSSTTERHTLVTFRQSPNIDTSGVAIMRNINRLDKLCELLFENIEDPVNRSNQFLAFIGNTLGAVSCSFCRIENKKPIATLKWESPFSAGVSPFLAMKQLYENIDQNNDNIVLFRKPALTNILESAKNENDEVEELSIKSILVIKILCNGLCNGLIFAHFSTVFVLSDEESLFLEKMSRSYSSLFCNNNSSNVLNNAIINRELLDSFFDSIYVIDSKGVFLDANKGAAMLYGYTKEEIIGKTPEFFSASGKNDIDQTHTYIELAANGESQKFEWWGQKKNGDIFPKEIILSAANINGMNLVVAVCRDISERYQVEQELLKSNKELQETNISKDKFFSILAHDLKNPFQGLLGFIDLLYEDLDELTTDQIKEYLFNVRTASYHTYNLLENLLDWSRIQSGKMPFTPTVFDVSDEVDSIINVLQTNATRKEIRMINEVEQETLVEADRNMIHSVIQNLITNSIKFSNTNGKVIIRSRKPKYFQKNADPEAESQKQWLEVSVSDNGIGIPEEILPKLFQLNGQFSQAGTANEPGTGLGLVLCREMVEKNGGKIWVESQPDQGATFIFTLPLSNS